MINPFDPRGLGQQQQHQLQTGPPHWSSNVRSYLTSAQMILKQEAKDSPIRFRAPLEKLIEMIGEVLLELDGGDSKDG